MEKKHQTVIATEKPAKWVFSKAVKIDAFERMCEKAWADSGLKDESIRKAVHDELAKWYKMDSRSPLAGYDKHHRPQSQEELEKNMYEEFDMQFSKYDKDVEEQDMEQDMEQTVKDEELEQAEWEYYEDETEDAPRAEATATINGYEVTVGYLWDVDMGCYVLINGNDVRDRRICEHYCEVVGKAIGKELTCISYELWKDWVEYHGRYEDWEDMDEDERYARYMNAIIQF